MGPPAIVFGAVAAVGTKAVIDDRNDRRREELSQIEAKLCFSHCSWSCQNYKSFLHFVSMVRR